MTQEIKKDGAVLCKTTVPYPKRVLLSMMEAGYAVYQDGKRVSKADVKNDFDGVYCTR